MKNCIKFICLLSMFAGCASLKELTKPAEIHATVFDKSVKLTKYDRIAVVAENELAKQKQKQKQKQK